MVNDSKRGSSRNASIKRLIITFTALILLQAIAADHFFRIDLSAEKRYTLSAQTRAILQKLKKPMLIELYLEGDMPPAFKRLKLASHDMLAEFQAWSHGNLEVKFIDPSGDAEPTKNESRINDLMKNGLQPLNLEVKTAKGSSQHLVFPSALLISGQKSVGISLMQNQNQFGTAGGNEEMLNHSVEALEYQFINAIAKVSQLVPPRVGMLDGNDESTGPQVADLVHSIKESYRIEKIRLQEISLSELHKINVLLMIKPGIRFSEPEKYKLDQYLMYGGKIIFSIDNLHAELDSMGSRGSTLGFARNLNLDDMFFKYGARINYDLIKDLNCVPIPVLNGATESSNQQSLAPWIYYPIVMPVPGNALVKNIDPVRCQFVSTLDTLASKGIHKTFLLSSSPYTHISGAPVFISLTDIGQASDPKTFREGKKPVAALLEGHFTSVFKNRDIDSADKSMPFLAKGKESSIIIVSDGDVFLNQINTLEKSVYPLGFDKYTRQVFGNKQFALNSVDYLIGQSNLISLRDKEIKLRMLDRTKVLEEKTYWQILNMVLPLSALVIFGIILSLIRKKRYS